MAVCATLLTIGCGDDSNDTTEEHGDGGPDGAVEGNHGDGGAATADSGQAGGDGGSDGSSAGGSTASELYMLQFDQVERYEFDTVDALGNAGSLVLEVTEVQDGEATVEITLTVDGQTMEERYVVPAGDHEAFVDAATADTKPGSTFVVQANDATESFAAEGIPWEVGREYTDALGTIAVTGEASVAGMECLTYESRLAEDDTLVQEGCITPDLEHPLSWTSYYGEGEVRGSMTLVAYEQG